MRCITYQPKKIKAAGGLQIYYEVSHPNRPAYPETLVFIHGLGGDAQSWDPERQIFHQQGYNTLAIDLRGHGLSERAKTAAEYSLDNFAADIHYVLMAENLRKTVLIGHCLGGMVTMTHEALYPESCQSLILIDTSYKPTAFKGALTDYRLLVKIGSLLGRHFPGQGIPKHVNHSKFKGTSDLDMHRLFSDVTHVSFHSYFLIVKNVLSFDGTKLLQRINIPTLIIQGQKDTIFPPEVAVSMHHRVKDSFLEFIPHANHIIVINNPNELVASIDRFLELQHRKSS